MSLDSATLAKGLALSERVSAKYRPVWDHSQGPDRAALALYFLPHKSARAELAPTRPQIVKWYCPFADQHQFPSGHRYCINVYTGCAHGCRYCYADGYIAEQMSSRGKDCFRRKLDKDLADLETYEVPLAPVHLSNSTDPFQALEVQLGDTRLALERILRVRHRFTSVVILTKNPRLATGPDYLKMLQQLNELPAGHPAHAAFRRQGLPGLRVEVSLAFWNDEVRAALEPGAPPVADRLDAIRQLRQAGIPVVLRIDPLFPRSPVMGKTLPEFGLPELQPLEDLDRLLSFAAEVGVRHIVHSPAKIVRPRQGTLSPVMQNLKRLYEHLAGPRGVGGRLCWRLPPDVAHTLVVAPFLELCQRHGLAAPWCQQNLITTP